MASRELISDAALRAVTCRARETRRSDGVLHDPFASHLITDRGEELFRAQVDSAAAFALAVCAATIDEVLHHAVIDHRIHAVAVLGAGLDTRPYRLEQPSDLRWIEADLRPVLGYKVLRLAHVAPSCQVRRVNVDLADAGERRGVLREIAKDVTRGLVLTEGFAMRLGSEAMDDLIERIPSVFKYWIVDTIAPLPNVSSTGVGRDNHSVEPTGPPEDILGAFERRRWQPVTFRPLKDQALRLDNVRAAELVSVHPPGELEGIWLFQHGF
jgi:O-methyltransferase involved in polyketide biosynthesis